MASSKELGNLASAANKALVPSFRLIQGVGADIRYAWRSLRRDKAFTLVALLSLSVGIGANVAVFGLMDALLWRQLPIRNPEQLVSLANVSRSYFGYSEFAKLSGEALQNVVAVSPVIGVPVDAASGTPTRQVAFVSGQYFQALGVTAEIGRPIQPFDDHLDHPAPAAVLSYSYWSRAWGGNPDVIGGSLYIGKAKFQIIGVAPQDFFGLTVGEAPDVWLPLTTYSMVFPGAGKDWLSGKNNNWLDLFGRLQNGVSASKAQAILSPIGVEIDIERSGARPTESERRTMLKDAIILVPAGKGISELRDRFSSPLHVVFSMLTLGLALACINVVSLQVARSDESRKEFAIRLAIGAGRFRIARQCLVEMAALSVVSGCLALLLFKPITTAVISVMMVWGNVPARLSLKVDAHLLGFVLLSSVGVAILCGLLPAVYASRQSLRVGLQSGFSYIAGHRSPTSVIRTVGVAQIAVSLAMISATCLFALNLGQLRRFDGGVKRFRLLEMEIDPFAAGYKGGRAVLLDERLRSRLESTPGVEHATYSADGIYSGRNFSGTFEVDGEASSVPERDRFGVYDYVGPNFFTTLGTAILAGRDFADRDTASAAPVAIINQTLATRFFPERNPIGRNLYVSDEKGKNAYQIVGVVRDVKSNLRTTGMTWYFAASQHELHPFSTYVLVRTRQDKAAVVTAIRAAIHDEDSRLQVANIQSANDLFELTLETDRLLAMLGWAFGILSVLLASAGIYGLLSYDVAKRTGEIGIRTALGACPSDIAKLMLSQTAFIVAFGLAFGGIAANVLARLLRSLVFELEASDPRIELTAAMILIAVALAAAWIPIQRAARLEPMRALRTE